MKKNKFNRDGRQFHQYQQNKQQTLVSNNWIQKRHNICQWKSGSWFGQNTKMCQKCLVVTM